MNGYFDNRQWFGDMVCDTPVPFYDVGVSCGLPNKVGEIPPEMMMVPGQLTMGLSVFMTRATGDSMEGVGIYEGDLLMMDNSSRYHSGDIVIARINGEEMLKTYYVDDDDRHWLIPSNDKYKPILLTADMDIQFAGRLLWHIRQPHESNRNIRQTLTRYKLECSTTETVSVPSYDEVVAALLLLASMVKVGRRWLGACRVLMDRKFIAEGRYDLFCDLVKKVLPNHQRLPSESELRHMAVFCFAKPFEEWKDKTAPVHGKHFKAYYEVGTAMQQALP